MRFDTLAVHSVGVDPATRAVAPPIHLSTTFARDEAYESGKMSKSVGNVVKPDALLERFGPDPLRYFLLREMTFGQDANFSDEGFLQRYNADLANGLGNTASRVLAMASRYLDGRTPAEQCTDNVLLGRAHEVVPRYLAAMDVYEFTTALEAVWELLAAVDGYVNEKAPWSVAKTEGAGSATLERILYNGLESLRLAGLRSAAVVPWSSMWMAMVLQILPRAGQLHQP